MTEKQAEAALKLALEHALRLAPSGYGLANICNEVYMEEQSLVKRLERPWFIRHMVHIAERLVSQGQRDSRDQLVIPGLDLPPRIEVPRGRKKLLEDIPTGDATLPDLMAHRKLMEIGNQQRLRDWDRLIAFMQAYAKDKKTSTLRETLGQHSFDFGEARTASR